MHDTTGQTESSLQWMRGWLNLLVEDKIQFPQHTLSAYNKTLQSQLTEARYAPFSRSKNNRTALTAEHGRLYNELNDSHLLEVIEGKRNF